MDWNRASEKWSRLPDASGKFENLPDYLTGPDARKATSRNCRRNAAIFGLRLENA